MMSDMKVLPDSQTECFMILDNMLLEIRGKLERADKALVDEAERVLFALIKTNKI